MPTSGIRRWHSHILPFSNSSHQSNLNRLHMVWDQSITYQPQQEWHHRTESRSSHSSSKRDQLMANSHCHHLQVLGHHSWWQIYFRLRHVIQKEYGNSIQESHLAAHVQMAHALKQNSHLANHVQVSLELSIQITAHTFKESHQMVHQYFLSCH